MNFSLYFCMVEIYIPVNSAKSIMNHARTHSDEVTGGLAYKKKWESGRISKLLVTAMYITGSGSEGYVKSDSKKIRVFNKFMEESDTDGFIEFHTHSQGTINQFGQYYAKNFSEGDMRTFQQMKSEDPRYISMLFTPTRIKAWPSNYDISLRISNEKWKQEIAKNQRKLSDLESII